MESVPDEENPGHDSDGILYERESVREWIYPSFYIPFSLLNHLKWLIGSMFFYYKFHKK